jgi:hypothetical protein
MSDKKEFLEEFQFADGKDRTNKENQISKAKELSSKPSLKKALEKSFDIYLRQHNVSVAGPPTPVADDVSDEVKKLFEL